jgi:hypothetical protein
MMNSGKFVPFQDNRSSCILFAVLHLVGNITQATDPAMRIAGLPNKGNPAFSIYTHRLSCIK